jgi:hypothetical protein
MCGVNYVAFIRFVPLNDRYPGPHWWFGGILSTTGTLELIGIAVGLVGLIVVASTAILRAVRQNFTPPSSKGQPD